MLVNQKPKVRLYHRYFPAVKFWNFWQWAKFVFPVGYLLLFLSKASMYFGSVGVKVLDRMLLYLRVVYSFDYYSTVEYPHEDAMPHRCGIFHARGPQPRGKVVQHDCEFLAVCYYS